MKRIDKRYQIGILFVGLLLISASIGSSLTRVFSSDGSGNLTDSIGGLIAAYNGNNVTYYSATWNNIQNAIDDVTANATVEIPSGIYSADKTIWCNKSYITIKGQGGKHWGTTGATVFRQGADLPNGFLNFSAVTTRGSCVEGIKFYNVSILDGDYQLVNKPTIIEI